MDELAERLDHIPWSSLHDSERQAAEIPKRILDLFSHDEDRIYNAISYLEDKLCHQWGAVLPALEPTFPFLVEALETQPYSNRNLIALLEFFNGIIRVVYSKIGGTYSYPLHAEFRTLFSESLFVFERYEQHSDKDVAGFASSITSVVKGIYEYEDFPF